MKKMMMGFGVLNLIMMIRGSIRGAPKIHWIFYISTYITFSTAINTGKLFHSLKVDEREMYIWFVVHACALKGLPFFGMQVSLTYSFKQPKK